MQRPPAADCAPLDGRAFAPAADMRSRLSAHVPGKVDNGTSGSRQNKNLRDGALQLSSALLKLPRILRLRVNRT